VALKDYRIPEEEIPLSGGASFAVRGLSLPHITHLVTKHGDAVKKLFNRATLDGSDLSLEDMERIGTTIIASSPDLAAEIIAVAAGEEDALDTIKALPFPVQVVALEAIARLTFDSAGGPKKFLETVIGILRQAGVLMGEFRRSKSGSLR